MKLPKILKSKRRRSAEKQAKVRKDAKDRFRRIRHNGHTPGPR